MSDTNDAGRAPTEEEPARAFQDLKNVHAIDVVNELLVSLYSFASTKLGLSDATAELRDLGDRPAGCTRNSSRNRKTAS